MTDDEMDHWHKRREAVISRACTIMGWDYKTSPVFTGLRKVAMAEAVAISLEKLGELLDRIEYLERDRYPTPEDFGE